MLKLIKGLFVFLLTPLRGDGLVAQHSFLFTQGILEASKARAIPIVIDAVSVAPRLLSPPHSQVPRAMQ